MSDFTLKIFVQKFAKFSAIGSIVTPLSMGTSFVLLKFYETPLYLTYVSVYSISILLSFYLNSRFTFKSEMKMKNLLRYYSIYLTGMIWGVILISIFKYFTNFENWVYPFLALPFTMSWNFFTSNKFLTKK